MTPSPPTARSSRSLRILWVSHFLLYPETGYGALQRSRNLFKQLCKYHEVDLICLYRDADKNLAPDLELAERDLKQYCMRLRIVPHPMTGTRKSFLLVKSLIGGVPYSVYLYRSDDLNGTIRTMLSGKKYDCILSDTIGMIEPVLDTFQMKKVLTHHNIESHNMYRRYMNENNFMKKLLFNMEYRNLRNYEKTFCGKYELNIVVSEIDQTRLKEIDDGIRTTVIENGVDCDYFSYHSRERDSRELIFTGALDYYPNAKAMFFFCEEVWPALKKKYADLKMTIIGKSPPKDLRKYLERHQDISLLGYVPDIRPHGKRAGVFLCPIREGGGTRLKILDAFSQGIPVVSTEIGAEGLPIENGKQLFLADTTSEFVDRISDLLDDDQLANRISRNAREFVERHYSFAYIGRRLADAFDATIGDEPVDDQRMRRT